MLPKLLHPNYEVKIPSNGKTYTFRPYTVREQKILLMMQETDSVEELSKCILDLIHSCSTTEGFTTKNLTYFDIEYLFLQIRSRSVDQISKVTFVCNNTVEDIKCNTPNTFEIDLSTIEVDMNNLPSREIEILGDITIKLRFPSIKSAALIEEYNATRNMEPLISAIAEDLEFVLDAEKIYDEFTKEEIRPFLESLDLNSFRKILEFYINTPKLKKNIDFKCKKCGYSETITISGITDFFE